jgi:aminoglycoside phosphotransferase (APT) family kinase protein
VQAVIAENGSFAPDAHAARAASDEAVLIRHPPDSLRTGDSAMTDRPNQRAPDPRSPIERRYPVLVLTPEQLERRLQGWQSGVRVTEIELLRGGLRNTNYRVALAERASPVVARFSVADPAACAREAALSQLLAGQVPRPELLYTDCAGDPPLAVYALAPGERFEDLLERAAPAVLEATAFAAGGVLARIHAVTFPAAGFLGPDLTVAEPFRTGGAGWAAYIEDFLFRRRVGEMLGAAMTTKLWELVCASALRLDPLAGDRSMVHADYQPANLLVGHDGIGWTVTAVLDWEFALAASPLLDVATFLRHADRLPAAYARGLIAGYLAGGGTLPPDWRAMAKLLDLLNLCSLLDQPGGGPATIERIRGLITATIGELGA